MLFLIVFWTFSQTGAPPFSLDLPGAIFFKRKFSLIFNIKHNHNYETGPKKDIRDQYIRETPEGYNTALHRSYKASVAGQK